MSDLTRWEPLNDLRGLRDDMNRAFSDTLARVFDRGEHWFGPLTDIYEDKDSVVLETEVPGYRREDIEVSVAGDTVTISGETRGEQEMGEGSYIRRERRSGKFMRSFTLPPGVDAGKLKANYTNGVLKVTMPKTPQAKKRSIRIDVD